MESAGIGGVIWMEVGGPRWAPQGPIEAGSKEWHEVMQWAIAEADRLGWTKHRPRLAEQGQPASLEPRKVIDLTKMMNAAGELRRDAPPGEWTVVRLGHATNLKMTRPVPASELGLECDRLHPRGSDWSA